MTITLEALDLKKVFERRTIFRNISFLMSEGQSLVVTGRNGSGKSTLLKILAHVLTPTEGSVKIFSGLHNLSHSSHLHIGFVAPYLTLYEEFSGKENLQFALAVRGLAQDAALIDRLLDRFSLGGFKHAPARVFSSGMKQRLKFAFALVHRPPVLLLDEPMANLDTDGINQVRELMTEHRKDGVLVVATNDISDAVIPDFVVDLNVSR